MTQTLGPLRHGKLDPCIRISPTEAWRAARTPEGPATMLMQPKKDEVRVRAWGAGAKWMLDQVPELIGESRERACFDHLPRTEHELVHRLHNDRPGLRFPRTGMVFEALVPVILEQRVTGLEAKRSYRQIVRWLSEPAPGPEGSDLYLPILPEVLRDTPAWSFHRFGVEAKRANALRMAARHAKRLEEAASMSHDDAMTRLQALPGLGIWTAAEVAVPALGHLDAVSIGDYHIKNYVAWALAKEPRATDERMMELLEPYAPYRGWVARLIMASGITAPKWGPRYNPLPIASY